MSKELELLRKKLDEEQDHFKKSVRNWENSNKELRDKATRNVFFLYLEAVTFRT